MNKFLIKTFGCQMNYSDTERLRTLLFEIGWEETQDQSETDLIILNTCSVKQHAEDKVMGLNRDFQELKKNNKKLFIALTGCIGRGREDEILSRMSSLDLVFDINTPSLLLQQLENKNQVRIPEEYLEIVPQHQSSFRAYVPIMTGCDNFCTYCIVPIGRGRERSRVFSRVVNEIKKLVENGYREITLLGQNVNSYRCPETEKKFVDLIKEIDQISGDFWLRFTSSHPKDFSDELIDFYSSSKHLCHHLHLPVQSGSDTVLEKMNRKYKAEDFIRIVEKIRKIKPDISITTDIIVGFPGETEEDFRETMSMVRQTKIDMIYISQYSARPGTPAARMEDTVSDEEKKRRWEELNDLLRKQSSQFLKNLLGKKSKVLITKIENDKIYGEISEAKKILLKSKTKIKEGEFVEALIIKNNNWSLSGEVIV